MTDDDYEDDWEARGPSKSARKREAIALQQLGEELVELKPEQLAAIPLEDELREAIALAQGISKRGGRKRQLQYIGKLMRGIEAEPIQQALAQQRAGGREETARLHRAESWRERLLAEGDAALGELLGAYPEADRQHLRQLIRKARQEREREAAAHTGARALFRYLRDLDEQQGGGD